MSDIITFAGEHPVATVLVAWSLFSLIRTVICRILRSVNILVRGWPTAPFMDSDGDIVHPKSGEQP